MNNDEYLNKLHSEILDIMDEIDRVCGQNEIKYYLVGGTLLGAVRHKGFIPWDDDLDIAMPRKDFDHFIDICENALKPEFKLEWISNNDEYWLPFAKVIRKNTLFNQELYANEGKGFGIFVDIFPLDTTKEYSRKIEHRSWWVRKIKAMLQINAGLVETSSMKKIICKSFPNKLLHQVMTYFMSKKDSPENRYYTNFGSQYSPKKQTIECIYYGKGKRIKFEDREYMCPENENAVLKKIYGEKYMELPPVDKRTTHYPRSVKFSDGVQVTFENTDK